MRNKQEWQNILISLVPIWLLSRPPNFLPLFPHMYMCTHACTHIPAHTCTHTPAPGTIQCAWWEGPIVDGGGGVESHHTCWAQTPSASIFQILPFQAFTLLTLCKWVLLKSHLNNEETSYKPILKDIPANVWSILLKTSIIMKTTEQ